MMLDFHRLGNGGLFMVVLMIYLIFAGASQSQRDDH